MNNKDKKKLQEINYRIAKLSDNYNHLSVELNQIDIDIKELLEQRSQLHTDSLREV